MKLVSTHAAETAVRTVMIGSLERIENIFGPLWGHEKEDADLTEEDEIMYEKYSALRESILDYGNEQICKLRGVKWIKRQ